MTTDLVPAPDQARRHPELPHVTTVEHLGKTLHILGTAHVSQASVDEVRRAIEVLAPDTVCVELCASRHAALTDVERWKKLDIFKVFREGKTLFLLANLAVGAYQRRLGQELGVMPGAELLAAIEAARARGIEVVLADRDVHVTLKRTWSGLGFWKKNKLLAGIIASLFEGRKRPADGDGASAAEEIERLKEGAHISEMMQELAKVLPEVERPLIDERDRYLVSKTREAGGPVVLSVVGAGHVKGMVSHLHTPVDRAELEQLPKPRWYTGIWKWVLPAILVATFFIGLRDTEGKALEELLLAWILPTSLASGLATALVGGKLVSIGSALLCSPITTVHPLIASGMIVGPVEAWARKPTVEDCENIHRDVQTFRGFFRNPFTRTLIVALAATIGSAIGAWIGLSWVISIVTR
ncbi:MAG: TraB/GumN family protein [Deltaproteobacteria bacterium]|nr:TraB/GumN family protein [Deltaproteobacteria bacterium]